MKSRRLINFPEAQREPSYRFNVALGKAPVGVKKQAIERRTDVRFGSKADICGATSHVRFTPNSDRESGFPAKVMSALFPKADMCSARGDVRYGP
jgi:hypothetical protein